MNMPSQSYLSTYMSNMLKLCCVFIGCSTFISLFWWSKELGVHSSVVLTITFPFEPSFLGYSWWGSFQASVLWVCLCVTVNDWRWKGWGGTWLGTVCTCSFGVLPYEMQLIGFSVWVWLPLLMLPWTYSIFVWYCKWDFPLSGVCWSCDLCPTHLGHGWAGAVPCTGAHLLPGQPWGSGSLRHHGWGLLQEGRNNKCYCSLCELHTCMNVCQMYNVFFLSVYELLWNCASGHFCTV